MYEVTSWHGRICDSWAVEKLNQHQLLVCLFLVEKGYATVVALKVGEVKKLKQDCKNKIIILTLATSKWLREGNCIILLLLISKHTALSISGLLTNNICKIFFLYLKLTLI